MIDENIIMPFNFFKYGGAYSGEHKGMKYLIKRNGEKPDFIFNVSVWQGPYASGVIDKELITEREFEFSEEGRDQAIEWLKQQYDERIDYWEAAPSILAAPPIIHE